MNYLNSQMVNGFSGNFQILARTPEFDEGWLENRRKMKIEGESESVLEGHHVDKMVRFAMSF